LFLGKKPNLHLAEKFQIEFRLCMMKKNIFSISWLDEFSSFGAFVSC